MALSIEGIRNRLRQQGLVSSEPEPSFYTYGAIPGSSISVNAQAEAARQAELVEQARQAEARRQAEIQRQAEAQRQADLARQQEIESLRQAEIQRQQEAERQRQVQLEAQRRAEAQRQAEIARQQEAARQAEAQRVAREQEAARQAEAQRVAKEAAARAEAERVAREQAAARRAEQERVAREAAARAEQERVAREAAQRAEAERVARQAELDRIAREQEQARIAEQQRVEERNVVTPMPTTKPEASPLQQVAEERNVVTPMPGRKPEAAPTGEKEAPLEQISKEVSQSKAPGSAIQDWAKKLEERGQKISLLPDLVTPGTKGLEGESEQVQFLSSLLQQNKFSDAFKYAQENNLHTYLLDHNKLKNLRTPLTRQEAEEFMYAAPKSFFVSAGELANKQTGKTSSRSFDELYNFDPKKAIESLGALAWVQPGEEGWSMSETGYPLLGRALEPKELKKEPNWFDKLIKNVVTAGTAAALAYAGGTALLGSSGAASGAGAAGVGGAGAGTGAAGAGAAGTAGASAAGAAGTGTAAGALPTFTVTTGGGLGAAGTAATLGAGAAGVGAATGGGGGTAATQPTTPSTQPPADLEEVVVQALRKAPPPDLATGLASVGAGQSVQDILTERDIAELQEAEQRMMEDQAAEQQPTPEEDPFQTVLVSGSRLPQLNVAEVVPGLAAQLAQAGYRSPLIEGQPPPPETLDAMEEIVVHGQKPTIPVDLAKIGLGGLTAAQIAQGFTQPNVDPTTGELREPLESQQELDKIQEALASGTTIPGTESMWDKISGAVDKLSTLQKLAALAGAFGAGKATAPKGTGIGVGAPTGGALPKYEFGRVQTRPDIDYFTYGTRPEVMFFEDTMSQAAPVTEGPVTGQAPPSEAGPFAKGGLAMGGRYYEGEGSGRDDKIPALLSDGEYVIDAETLALLGDGSPKEGARRMDEFRAKIRKHKGSALSRGRISPNAKSPDKYMGGGLA